MSKTANPRPKKSKAAAKATDAARREISEGAQNPLASTDGAAVTSDPTTNTPGGMEPPATAGNGPGPETKTMPEQTITLKRNTSPRKSDRLVIFDGGHLHSVQFLATAFPPGEVPDTLTITGNFAEPTAPKAKMTPEERKAARAAQPKLTLAERVAKAEERAAQMREKLAKAQAQPAPEPVGV